MQTAVPDVVSFADESATTLNMYGIDQAETKTFGQQMLAARRLVERGVRFVQVYHGSNGGAGNWDAHGNLKNSHSRLAKQTDQPIGALLKDLKQRGLLDETLVVWATEFGRTPVHRIVMAAITILTASRFGWRAVVFAVGWYMVQPMNLVSMR